MKNIKVIALDKTMITNLVKALILIGLLTLAPMFHKQMITGPIVNAILFVSVYLFGVQNAVLIGLIPSVIALSVGLLPAVMAPMVPFIMLSNAILIIIFNYLKDKNYWLGVISASILKFLFLFATGSIVVNLLLKKEIATKVASMMSWPQLVTALIGGIIAYFFLRSLKQVK